MRPLDSLIVWFLARVWLPLTDPQAPTRATWHPRLCRWFVCKWLGHRLETRQGFSNRGTVHTVVLCAACRTFVFESVDTLGDARCASGEEVVRR